MCSSTVAFLALSAGPLLVGPVLAAGIGVGRPGRLASIPAGRAVPSRPGAGACTPGYRGRGAPALAEPPSRSRSRRSILSEPYKAISPRSTAQMRHAAAPLRNVTAMSRSKESTTNVTRRCAKVAQHSQHGPCAATPTSALAPRRDADISCANDAACLALRARARRFLDP